MIALQVRIEIEGSDAFAGWIRGNDSSDACFSYAPEYLERPDARAVSVSLPLQTAEFTPAQTRNYFEGLLPEGFLKMTVAQRMRTDENDYISILSGLGGECLGAVTVIPEGAAEEEPRYEGLSLQQLRELAEEGATKSVQMVTKAHLSLAGASGKVGLYYNPEEMKWYLPLGKAPSTHIVKQSHVRLDSIVTNERLSLLTAHYAGIETPESNIINTGAGEENEVLFATKRYDRLIIPEADNIISGLDAPYRLHQEDFGQALGIAPVNKYEPAGGNYMKQMFQLIREHSANPIEDQIKLWRVIVFDYFIGNTDNHVKNYSLLYGPDLKKIRLAPAYDVISTVIYESSAREMAFHIGGEIDIDRIDREAFRRAAAECGLGDKIAMKHFDDLQKNFRECLMKAAEELKTQGFVKAKKLAERILAERNHRCE